MSGGQFLHVSQGNAGLQPGLPDFFALEISPWELVMPVSSLTKGCKKSLLELSQQDEQDLELAVRGRMGALRDLHKRTSDPEDRERLLVALARMGDLLDRLVKL